MRLVAISNRVAVPRKAAAPGGLAVGVLAALRGRGGLWFGASGDTVHHDTPPAQVQKRDGITYATIDLPAALHAPYYNGFANGTLWPLFHSFLGSFRYAARELEAYDAVNALFARHVLPLLEPDDLIWVHDYHLILLADKLRALGAAQRLGLFIHIPFPPVDVLRALPPAIELVRALLAFDSLGFQTAGDRDNFLAAVGGLLSQHLLGPEGTVHLNGRTIRTEVYPIGVDLDDIASSAASAMHSEPVARMVQGLLGRKLVIGVDRLDYSKGLVERFGAYREFLEAYPEHHNRVTFLQIAPLSRTDVREYAEIRRSLEQTTGRINGRFADTDWTPIRYLNRDFPREVLMGFLRAAQVCLVTPLRDGMNLVAKEFVAAQDPSDPGVLILSSLAGAAAELDDALIVNPYDSRGIARAVQNALTMPLIERRDRHHKLMAALRANDIHRWYERFLDSLKDHPVSSVAACATVPREPTARAQP
jgi:trehalose 6-phosphate synthase